MPRGEVDIATGMPERTAQRIVSALIDKGVLTSGGPRAPLHLVFSAALAPRWMPGLYPPLSSLPSSAI